MVRVGLLFAGVLLAGCAHRPELVWTSFGRADPARDTELVVEWRETRDLLVKRVKNPEAMVTVGRGKQVPIAEYTKATISRLRDIEVLVDTAPPGLVLEQDTARVSAGSGLTLVGKFSLRYRQGARPLKEALDDVRVLVDTVEGNLAVITWQRVSQTHTLGASGFVLKVSGPGAVTPRATEL